MVSIHVKTEVSCVDLLSLLLSGISLEPKLEQQKQKKKPRNKIRKGETKRRKGEEKSEKGTQNSFNDAFVSLKILNKPVGMFQEIRIYSNVLGYGISVLNS